MATTAIICLVNLTPSTLTLRNRERKGWDCNTTFARSSTTAWKDRNAGADSYACCNMWVPWCTSQGDFDGGRVISIERHVPLDRPDDEGEVLGWIWQGNQADGDLVRHSRSGYEQPGRPIPGAARVSGDRDCGLTVKADYSVVLWEVDRSVEIPWLPWELADEHMKWHAHGSHRSGSEFLSFHRDFLARFREWYDRQSFADPALVAPWPTLPPEFNQPHDPAASGWFSHVRELETNLYKWSSADAFGDAIQNGLHSWLHHIPITTCYRDALITNFHTTAKSRNFYRMHGMIDGWWRRWEAGRAAVYVKQSVPTSVTAGARFTATVTMRNTGRSEWTPGGTQPFLLGSQDPQDNRVWGLNRVTPPATVAPNTEVTFQVGATAPASPGTYRFRWQMVQERVAWFGDRTSVVSVVVTAPPPDPAGNGAAFVSQSVPAAVNALDDTEVEVTMRNTGRTTWVPGGSNPFRLGSQNPQDNNIWGTNRVELANPVAPGAQVTFRFVLVPPPVRIAPYDFQWRMVQDGVGWFGETTPNARITVRRSRPRPPHLPLQ